MGSFLFTSAPSSRRRSCYNLRHFVIALCHDALKFSSAINSCSVICFAFKMDNESGMGRFARRILSIQQYNLSSRSVYLRSRRLKSFLFCLFRHQNKTITNSFTIYPDFSDCHFTHFVLSSDVSFT